MDFKLITNIPQLMEIEADYKNLLERIEDRQVFYEFAWLKNYILHYPDRYAGKDGNLRMVTGWLGKTLVLVCPLCMRKNTLSFICEEATDYNTILIDAALNKYSAMKDVAAYIKETVSFKKMVLSNFRYSDILLNLYTVTNYNGGGYASFMKLYATAPYCNVKADSAKFVKKQVSDIRRRQKLLLAEHEVCFKDSDVITESDLEFITGIKDESFGDNIFTGKKSWEFFLHLSEEMKENIIVHRMYVDKKCAAIHLGFTDKEKVCYFIPAYDHAVKGAGLMLLLHIIEKEAADGKSVFDSLRGEESYKYTFCDRIASNFTLTVIPLTRLNKVRLFCYKAGKFVLGKLLLGGSV